MAVISERNPATAALTPLLRDASPTILANALKSLGHAAMIEKLDAPPPQLVACLDDEAEPVRVAAIYALIKYRQGPELLFPVALIRLPSEGRVVGREFTRVFWSIRLEPSVLPLLIEGLKSENTDVCLTCTAAINHMGCEAASALPAILTLLRKELKEPHLYDPKDTFDIVAMASGAIGEISPEKEPMPGTVELLCDVLKAPIGSRGRSDPAGLEALPSSAEGLKSQSEFRLAEAAWSLGILGRYATSAVPKLISTFEKTPEDHELIRGIAAEALVEITRGTPDEDLVVASLAKAWKTASPKQKAIFTRALRSLGPKTERLVPELRQMPPDATRARIRRVRYPRSDQEEPVRE